MAMPDMEPLLPENKLAEEQTQDLMALMRSGKWKTIVPQMFPLIPRPAVEHAREIAIDSRDKYLTEIRLPQIKENLDIFSDDEEMSKELSQQMAECLNEKREMIMERDTGDDDSALSLKILAEQIEMQIQRLTSRLEVYENWQNVDLSKMTGLIDKPQARHTLDSLAEKLLNETSEEIELLAKQRDALLGTDK